MSLQQVPLNKIRITENHRVNVELTHLDELMQSIQQRGVMQPIGLMEDDKGKGKYILKWGQRRVIASEKLGYKTIPALIGKFIKEEDFILENLTENLQRHDPTFAEYGRLVDKLRRTNFAPKEIAVRLGLPYPKIRVIIDVYDALPEKYRKHVVFREKGQKSKKGTVPAATAVKLLTIKKQHGIKGKNLDKLFDAVKDGGMNKLDLNNVGVSIHAGMSVEQALSNVREYGVFTVDIVIRHIDLSDAMEKYGLVSKQHLFKKILYGELPPLKKPDFVSTGICMNKDGLEKDKKIDLTFARGMLRELIGRCKTGKMNDNQQAAVRSIEKLPLPDWTEAHCEQIKEIFEKTK